MKKLLRFLVILISIVIAGILVLGLVEPKSVVVLRSTMIKAPKEAVFEQIQYFKNWTNWDPWYKMNPTMKITFAGTDGQPGSSFHWAGGDEKKTGEGTMSNLATTGTNMDYQIDILKPYKVSNKGYINAKDSAGMTKVIWTCNAEMSFPWNAAFAVMNMDKMLGPDFDSGLANMKQYLESRNMAATTGIDVKEVDFPEHTYEGIRKAIPWTEIEKLCGDSWETLGKGMQSKINGPATGLYFTWDTATKSTDMAAAFPAYDTTKPLPGSTFIHVGAAKAYMAVYKGGYSNMMPAHMAIMKQMDAKGLKHSLVVEEYKVGRHQEPDSTKWVTNIYYLVQ